MKLFQQFMAAFLALGFACSGAVALNPALHQLIEHGGQGRVHTHSGGAQFADSIWHDDGDGHLHRHSLQLRTARTEKLPFDHVDKFYLPHIPLGKLLIALGQLFQNQSPVSGNSSDHPSSHQHHSLPSMLLGGMLDQPFLTGFVFIPTRVFLFQPSRDCPRMAHEFDAHSLGRGPPLLLS